MTPAERVAAYSAAGFPNCLGIGGDGRISGVWVLGNDYRVRSGYHGGYPNTYLRRVAALFPDRRRVLHLFSGRVDLEAMPGDTVDLRADLAPTYVCDAQTLEGVPVERYDLILADPPYSDEDAARYGTTLVSRNRVMDALGRRAAPGTRVVWLDMVLPMYRREDWGVFGYIGLVRSTNHRFRLATMFEGRGAG